MKIELKIQLMTFKSQPNVIGLCVTGVCPPDDDKGLIDFVREVSKDFTPKMNSEIAKTGTLNVSVTRNNDPERPDDELFLQYKMPFKITKKVCDLFQPGAYRFVASYYSLSLLS